MYTAYIPNLTALNLLNNPLEFPPLDVVNKGIKQVKEFLKINCTHRPEDFTKLIPKSEEPSIFSVNDDMWASDSGDDQSGKRSTSTMNSRKSTGKKLEQKSFFKCILFLNSFSNIILCFSILNFYFKSSFFILRFFVLGSLQFRQANNQN
jgi:hypothetical protein